MTKTNHRHFGRCRGETWLLDRRQRHLRAAILGVRLAQTRAWPRLRTHR